MLPSDSRPLEIRKEFFTQPSDQWEEIDLLNILPDLPVALERQLPHSTDFCLSIHQLWL
jgi:hypothetical protein